MSPKDFVVKDRGVGKGLGVYSLKAYSKGDLIANISGEIVNEHMLHTLQITSEKHLYDPDFTGCLLHSCDPNAIILPEKLEVWAVKNIKTGDAITIDYATTENRIVRQFPCACGQSNCRRWITGRKEMVNEEGIEYLTKIEENQNEHS
jgi:SET domain-containing protein